MKAAMEIIKISLEMKCLGDRFVDAEWRCALWSIRS
jgi:hypothetical protein